MGGKKKYIEMFGSLTEPFYCPMQLRRYESVRWGWLTTLRYAHSLSRSAQHQNCTEFRLSLTHSLTDSRPLTLRGGAAVCQVGGPAPRGGSRRKFLPSEGMAPERSSARKYSCAIMPQ